MKKKNEENIIEKNVAKDVTPKNSLSLKKKKTIIVIVSVVVLIIALCLGWYIYEVKTNNWDVKQKEITIEYGEVFEPTITDLIDNEKYPNVTPDNTTVVCNIENEENKDYPAVGKYEITVRHNMEYDIFGVKLFSNVDTKKINLVVKDTITPKFVTEENINPTELEFIKDCKDESVVNRYKATDLADVTISFIDTNVDYSTIGEYEATVQAKDKSSNVAEIKVKVKVVEPSIVISPSSANLKVGETATFTADVKGKNQNVEWISSDESIVSVENGKVTAKKAGTATVTGKANGKENSVTVTVASVEKPNKNNNSQSNNNTGNSGNQAQDSSNANKNNNSGNTKPKNHNSNASSSGSGNSTTTVKQCTNNNNHGMPCGNVGRWFSSRNELDTYFKNELSKWTELAVNNKITGEELFKYKPFGYESWSCPYCGKWSCNFEYR